MNLNVHKLTLLFLFPMMCFSDAGNLKMPCYVKHPFYVSVIEINNNDAAKTLEISCKFFSNDLEQILSKDYNTQLDITLEKYKTDFNKFIPDYISRHFQLVVNSRPATIHYIGFEKEKESAYAYFEVSNINEIKTINITNSLLYDFIDQQINIMHITVSGKRQSTKLDYPATQATFSF